MGSSVSVTSKLAGSLSVSGPGAIEEEDDDVEQGEAKARKRQEFPWDWENFDWRNWLWPGWNGSVRELESLLLLNWRKGSDREREFVRIREWEGREELSLRRTLAELLVPIHSSIVGFSCSSWAFRRWRDRATL